jgi:hypothetical protein
MITLDVCKSRYNPTNMTHELLRRCTYKYVSTDGGNEALAEIRLFMQTCHISKISQTFYRWGNVEFSFIYEQLMLKIRYRVDNNEILCAPLHSICVDESSVPATLTIVTDKDEFVFVKDGRMITQIPVGAPIIGNEGGLETGNFQITGQFVCDSDAPTAFKAIQAVQNALKVGFKDTGIPFQFQIRTLTMKSNVKPITPVIRETIDDTDIVTILRNFRKIALNLSQFQTSSCK